MNRGKPHVVVFYGGTSGNQDLSQETGEWFCQYVPRTKYQVTPVEVMSDGTWKVPLGSLPTHGPVERMVRMLSQAIRPLSPAKALERLMSRPVDAFWSFIRGKGGDDGSMHSLGQTLSIPVVGSSLATCQQTFNKHACSHLLSDITNTPYSRYFRQNTPIETILEETRDQFIPPLFVKPTSQEGSLGVEQVNSLDELATAVAHAKLTGDILIQERRPGTEISLTLAEDDRGIIRVLPPTIIIPQKATFYDHQAKRREGRVVLHTPKTQDNRVIAEAESIARDIYDELNCKGIITLDMIAGDDAVDVLEVNTVPTFSALTPTIQQLKAAGIHPSSLFDRFIERSLEQG